MAVTASALSDSLPEFPQSPTSALAFPFRSGVGASERCAATQEKANNFVKEKSIMPVKNPKELFVTLLSHVRHGSFGSSL
jgi:hypothetical protein